MKTISNIYLHFAKAVRQMTDYPGTIKIFMILFLLVIIRQPADAQCPGHNGPSCNFFGPLVACAGTSNTDTITVSYGSTLPEFTFKFLVNGTGGSTNGIVTPYGGFSDSTFNGTVVINNGSSAGSEDIQVTVYVTFSDGCTDSTICTKSITVIDIEATTQFAPIVCKGGTTTLQVNGSGGNLFQYTLQPNGPTNNTGTFPGLPAGSYCVKVQGESFVQKIDTCTTTICNINIPDGSGGIVYAKCPSAKVEPSCTSASAISADFSAWKAAFHDSADAGVTITGNAIHFSSQSPPDACTGAGTVTGIDSVFSACDTVVCSSTFSVTAAPTPSITCPSNFTEQACLTQSQINTDFTTWLAKAKGSGGCNGNITNNNTGAPNTCSGGTTTVTFTYSSTCAPLTTICSATFTVPPTPAIQLTCAGDQTIQGSGGSGGCGGNCVDLGGGGVATYPGLPSREPKPSHVKVDFSQPRNANAPADPLDWTNGCLNETQATYYEGMGVPQRIIFSGLDAGTHSLIFRHECVKHQSSDPHAYDFLMSWEQAVATAGNINGSPNVLGNLLTQACGKQVQLSGACSDVDGNNVARATLPDLMGNPPNHHGIANVNDVIACFEKEYGDRTIEMDGNAPISNFTITFDGYDGTPDGFNYAWYTINWTSDASEVMIKLAGRAAASSGDCGYGACWGAGSISGAPYHFKLELLDNASLGNRDNQVMVDCKSSCTVEVPVTFGTPTVQDCHNPASVPAVDGADSISYDQITGNKTTCRKWKVIDPVCGDSSVCMQCITVTCGPLRKGDNALIGNDVITAYPNPFNSQTTIQFTFSTDKSNVAVEVFGLNGDKVAMLFNAPALAGVTNKVTLDANKLSDGIYIYRINAAGKFYYGKLALMK